MQWSTYFKNSEKNQFSAVVRKLPDYQKFEPGFCFPLILPSGIFQSYLYRRLSDSSHYCNLCNSCAIFACFDYLLPFFFPVLHIHVKIQTQESEVDFLANPLPLAVLISESMI